MRAFYTDKAEHVLGHIHLYDRLIGWPNLITPLRVAICHDQLHYDDVMGQANALSARSDR